MLEFVMLMCGFSCKLVSNKKKEANANGSEFRSNFFFRIFLERVSGARSAEVPAKGAWTLHSCDSLL